jgi:hypothetical protein
MAYGAIKVDNITFTNGGADQPTTVSGIYRAITSGVTVTGTISGVTIQGATVSGTTVTGTTANFTSGNFTALSGASTTVTSGIFAVGSAAAPSISFTSDPNTGIYSPGADQVAISTNGTGRLFVDASGNVGIGTTSPDAALTVVGTGKFTATQSLRLNGTSGTYSTWQHNGTAVGDIGTSNQVFSGGSTTDFGITARSATSLVFGTNTIERARIDSSGRVGINTSSPSYTLDVNGQIRGIGSATALRASNGSGSGQTSIGLTREGAPADQKTWEFLTGASGEFTLRTINDAYTAGQDLIVADRGSSYTISNFQVHTNGSERLRIDSSGRVGIGTSAPGVKLEVRGSLSVGENYIDTLNTDHSITLRNTGAVNNNNYTARMQAAEGGPQPSDSSLAFLTQTWNGSAYVLTEKMRIDSSGNVGIGTTSPAYALDIAAADTTAGIGYAVRLRANLTAGAAAIQFTNATGLTQAFAIVADTSSNLKFLSDSNVERARIDSSGRLLVGTSSARSNFFGASYASALQVETASVNSPNGLSIGANSNDDNPANLYLFKTRGTSVGSNTVVQSGDVIGSLNFIGADGTNVSSPAAWIRCAVDGTPGVGDMPGRLVFSTTADGSASPTERARIDSSGNLLVGTSTAGTARVGIQGTTGNSTYAVEGLNVSVGGNTVNPNGRGVVAEFSAGGASDPANTYGATINLGASSIGAFGIRIVPGAAFAISDYYPGGAYVGASNPPTERLRIDSSGRLLVGTSSALLLGSSLANYAVNIETLVGGSVLNHGIGATRHGGTVPEAGQKLTLARSRGTTIGSVTLVANGDQLGALDFAGADGTDFGTTAAEIVCEVDGTPGANDMPGRLVFSTTADGAASPTERMVIKSNGDIRINQNTTSTPGLANTTAGIAIENTNAIFASRASGIALFLNRNNDGATTEFHQSGNVVGTITVTASATAYNTSSDYRLKENLVPLTGAIDRVNDLQVHRFNFIADPGKTVDGFIAHDAQAVVPECVTGTKDEVDGDGNPVYQGIDQSKLVPLLTAALQEAIAKIETLEARLTAAGIA